MVTFLQNFALSEYASIIRPKAVKAYLESVSKQDHYMKICTVLEPYIFDS